MQSSPEPAITVLDASAVLALLVPHEDRLRAGDAVARLHRSGSHLLCPSLAIFEVTSALRRYESLGHLTSDEVSQFTDLFFALDLTFAEPDRAMAQRALEWAERLGQSKAYDAFYVALAELVDGVLWTEDHRLLNRCRQLELDWVQAMG